MKRQVAIACAAHNRPQRIRAALAISLYILACAILTVGAIPPSTAHAESECFAMITDTHIGVSPSTSADLKKALRYIKPQKNLAAVVHCGDVTDVGGEAEYAKYARIWRKSRIKAAAVYTFGNHDNAAKGYQNWLHRAGYYGYDKTTGASLFRRYLNGGRPLNTVTKFKTANVIAIGGYVGQRGGVYPWQSVRWLDRQLKATVRAGKVAIVATHYAPWHGLDDAFRQRPANQMAIYGVCQSYPNVVFACGHEHRFEQDPTHFRSHYSYGTYAEAARTPFRRTGIDTQSVRYKVHLLCLNAVSRVRGCVRGRIAPERSSWAYLLKVTGSGRITFAERNLTARRTERKTAFEQETSSALITLSGLPAGEEAAVKVRFSDGGSHGGIASGETVRLKAGKGLRITGIPQGVLVVARVKKVPAGYTAPEIQRVEVSKRTARMAFAFERGKKARTSKLKCAGTGGGRLALFET